MTCLLLATNHYALATALFFLAEVCRNRTDRPA